MLRNRAIALVILFISSTIHASVPGWPSGRIAMGTVVDGTPAVFQTLQQRPVDSVFSYAGNNGAGDRGTFISVDTKIQNIMNQTRTLETEINKTIIPVVVFYSVDGSDGVWAIQQDLDIDPQTKPHNLYLHYANLIRLCQLLESYKDEHHVMPASIILNPDFLGELHKQCGQWYCPIPFDQSVDIADGLQDAMQFLVQGGYIKSPVTIPPAFLQSNTTIADYIMSINWIIRTFAPDVTFGWQDNVWAGDSSGHLWLHQAAQQPDIINTHITGEAAFLKSMNVNQDPYKPDFMVFDKWERDVFDSGLKGAGLQNGYLYNSNDWDVYMQFVSGISHQFNDMPVMLWQIPGGHLQINKDLDARGDHASTAPDYFLGDVNLSSDLSNVQMYIANSKITPANYFVTSDDAVAYLRCPQADPDCWHKNRLADIAQKNVFAILWGGGSTTGVAGASAVLDDSGWLYNHLK